MNKYKQHSKVSENHYTNKKRYTKEKSIKASLVCSKKRQFLTTEKAEAFIKRRKYTRLEIYECNICNFFHTRSIKP